MVQGIASDVRVARLTIDQLRAMVQGGIVPESDPIELIDGVLVYKDRSAVGEDPMTIGEKHNLVIKLLARLDPALVQQGCHMQTQGPVVLSPHDAPEPDGLVLRGDPRSYGDRLPEAADATAVIEVSDSSLEHDRTRKLALYAQAGIPQYVIIDLTTNVVEVYEQPTDDGAYGSCTRLMAGDALQLRTGDAAHLRVEARQVLP